MPTTFPENREVISSQILSTRQKREKPVPDGLCVFACLLYVLEAPIRVELMMADLQSYWGGSNGIATVAKLSFPPWKAGAASVAVGYRKGSKPAAIQQSVQQFTMKPPGRPKR